MNERARDPHRFSRTCVSDARHEQLPNYTYHVLSGCGSGLPQLKDATRATGPYPYTTGKTAAEV